MEGLELLLVAGCAFGNSEGCTTSAQAYGRYSGIEQKLQEYGDKHQGLSYALAIAGAAKEQRVAFPIVYNFYASADREKYMILYKREY